jgi:hypothetical protein
MLTTLLPVDEEIFERLGEQLWARTMTGVLYASIRDPERDRRALDLAVDFYRRVYMLYEPLLLGLVAHAARRSPEDLFESASRSRPPADPSRHARRQRR